MSRTAVADVFLSDVHLRLDRPDRSDRLAGLVGSLSPDDRLFIGGDLCDFWFASRQHRGDPMRCDGLRSLAAFVARGGELAVLPGNHDAWLGPFYEEALGGRFVDEPLEVESFGLRVHLVHGHRLGARSPWKGVMEGRTFLKAFGALPGPLARGLARRLGRSNRAHLEETHRRHLIVYRDYAHRLAERADLLLFGHVHDVFDEAAGRARLIVLGDWTEGSSFLRVDEHGARFRVDRPASH